MITKYICSYCGEEFKRVEECRTHESDCANKFKNELLLFVYGVGWVDGKTFIEEDYSFQSFQIIKNTGYDSMKLFCKRMEEDGYSYPLSTTFGDCFNGFYYWSNYYQCWGFVKKWDNILTRIVNTGTDIEDR